MTRPGPGRGCRRRPDEQRHRRYGDPAASGLRCSQPPRATAPSASGSRTIADNDPGHSGGCRKSLNPRRPCGADRSGCCPPRPSLHGPTMHASRHRYVTSSPRAQSRSHRRRTTEPASRQPNLGTGGCRPGDVEHHPARGNGCGSCACTRWSGRRTAGRGRAFRRGAAGRLRRLPDRAVARVRPPRGCPRARAEVNAADALRACEQSWIAPARRRRCSRARARCG